MDSHVEYTSISYGNEEESYVAKVILKEKKNFHLWNLGRWLISGISQDLSWVEHIRLYTHFSYLSFFDF